MRSSLPGSPRSSRPACGGGAEARARQAGHHIRERQIDDLHEPKDSYGGYRLCNVKGEKERQPEMASWPPRRGVAQTSCTSREDTSPRTFSARAVLR